MLSVIYNLKFNKLISYVYLLKFYFLYVTFSYLILLFNFHYIPALILTFIQQLIHNILIEDHSFRAI